jgi:hypothetical protein
MRYKTVIVAFLALSVFTAGTLVQEPRWPGIYFSNIGANTADASIVRSTVSDEAILTLNLLDTSTALQFRNDKADTYYPLTQPDADITGGAFTFPSEHSSDTVTTSTDNQMVCQQIFMPGWLTVNNIMIKGVVASDSSTDDTLAVAIYEDATAGVRLVTTGASADFTSTAVRTLAVTDTTLGPGFYRLCYCAQDVTGVAFHAATLDDEAIDVMNQGVVTFGTAANACAAGVPPTTTGALTTADLELAVIKLSGG